MGKPRARDLGLRFPGTPGKFNAITDVPGVEVGFSTLKSPATKDRPQIYTGVTAVLPRGHHPVPLPVWAGQFDLNGNGEMTGSHWVRDAGYFQGPVCLTNTHSVGIVHHAAVGWMIERYAAAFRDAWGWAMPVVAETYDGITNDVGGRHVTEKHALEALNGARSGPLEEGNVGGGTGMQTYEFKGGTGTSSRQFQIEDQVAHRRRAGAVEFRNTPRAAYSRCARRPPPHRECDHLRCRASRDRFDHRAHRNGCAALTDPASQAREAGCARHRAHGQQRRALLGRSHTRVFRRQSHLFARDRRGAAA